MSCAARSLQPWMVCAHWPGHVHVHAYVCFDVHVYMHVLLLHVLILHVDVPAIETC